MSLRDLELAAVSSPGKDLVEIFVVKVLENSPPWVKFLVSSVGSEFKGQDTGLFSLLLRLLPQQVLVTDVLLVAHTRPPLLQHRAVGAAIVGVHRDLSDPPPGPVAAGVVARGPCGPALDLAVHASTRAGVIHAAVAHDETVGVTVAALGGGLLVHARAEHEARIVLTLTALDP